MATMIDGESYLGHVLVRRLSKTEEVSLYLWPLRCLKSKMGGPTFGVDVNKEEIIRFDPHGPRGHWHKGGYDKLGAGGSHVEFPDEIRDIEGQVEWSLDQIREKAAEYLADAGHPNAADALDADMIELAIADIKTHLGEEGDLRTEAIEKDLIRVGM